MNVVFDPRPAAQRLARAWHDQSQLESLPVAERPTTLAQGYAIQDALCEVLAEGRAGWKIAGSSVAGLRASEFGVPLFGFLRPSCVHASGARLAAPERGKLTVEVEIAVTLARDVIPAQESLVPDRMISQAHLAIEVVYSRYTDRKSVGAASFVGDDAGLHAFFLGDALDGGAQSPALAAAATLWHDGAEVTQTLHGDARTDPLASLALFWQHAAERDIRLAAGDIITTGTLILPLDTAASGRYEGRLGDYRVAFEVN